MNAMKLIGRGGLAAVLSLSFAIIVLPNVSAADRTATSADILVISDEIHGNSVEVERASGGGCGSGGDSSGTDSSNTSSNSSGGTGGNNTSNNCSNNSSTDT